MCLSDPTGICEDRNRSAVISTGRANTIHDPKTAHYDVGLSCENREEILSKAYKGWDDGLKSAFCIHFCCLGIIGPL